MTLTIIAALNAHRVIGKNGSLLWNIPDDLQRFKQLTLHHTVIMGRKTFHSIGSALPERRNIVISHSRGTAANAEFVPSVDEALLIAQNDDKVFIIGGGEIFRQTLGRADAMELTIVDNASDGDAFFPPYEHMLGTTFLLQSMEQHHGFRFESYVRSADTPAVR